MCKAVTCPRFLLEFSLTVNGLGSSNRQQPETAEIFLATLGFFFLSNN